MPLTRSSVPWRSGELHRSFFIKGGWCDTRKLTLKPLLLDRGKGDDKFNKISKGGREPIIPYEYQLAVSNKIKEIVESGEHGVILLKNPTGSGKSLAGYSGALVHGYKSVFMYPTRELVREQYESFLDYEIDGKRVDSIPSIMPNKINAEEIERSVANYYKSLPERLRKKARNLKALKVEEAYTEPTAVFTTIDSFYYCMNMSYGGKKKRWKKAPYEYLRIFAHNFWAMRGAESSDVFFFDEFDSYDVKQKCSIEWMICMLAHPAFQRGEKGKCVILASATPEESMVKRLREAGVAVHDEFDEKTFSEPSETMVQIMPEVGVTFSSQGGFLRVSRELDGEKLATWIKTRFGEIDRNDYAGKKKWMAIICDSMTDCHETAEKLRDLDIPGEDIGEIHGFSVVTDEDRQEERNKLILIGNRSIDIGIDFDVDCLVMTGPTTSSFTQRIGRLRGSETGRKRECYMIVPPVVYKALEATFEEGATVSRQELGELIWHGNNGYSIYPRFLKYLEFQHSYAPLEFMNVLWNRYAGLKEKYNPHAVRNETKQRIREEASVIFKALYNRGDIESVERQWRGVLSAGKTGDEIDSIEGTFSRFRSSASLLPCIVHDPNSRRRKWKAYGVEQVLRYGDLVPDKCDIIDPKTYKPSNHVDDWYEMPKAHLPRKVPLIEINGFKDKKKRAKIWYSIHGTEMKEAMKRTSVEKVPLTSNKYEKKKVAIIPKYPVVVGSKSGVLLVSDDPSTRSVIDSFVNPLLLGVKRPFYFAIIKGSKKNAWNLSFEMDSLLHLPMFDQVKGFTSFIKSGNPSREIPLVGICAVDLHAYLLESAIAARKNYIKKTMDEKDGD